MPHRFALALARHYGLAQPPDVLAPRATLPAVARLQVSEPHLFVLPRHVTEDAFLVRIELGPGGSLRQFAAGDAAERNSLLRPGAMHITALQTAGYALVCSPFDSVLVHLPRTALQAAADEAGLTVPASLACPPDTRDPVLAGLVQALLPALKRPRDADPRFVSHVLHAFCQHVLQHHASSEAPAPASRVGALTAEQLTRAQALLIATPAAPLEAIAHACGFSRSHFGKAFRAATGRAPHAWSMDQRVAQAQSLLTDTDQAIAEVAARCGFADQRPSHPGIPGTPGLATRPVAPSTPADLTASSPRKWCTTGRPGPW